MEINESDNNMKIYYDIESDYLEILFGEIPAESSYEKIAPDTFVRVNDKSGEVVGYAIYNVKKSDSPLKAINLKIPKSACF